MALKKAKAKSYVGFTLVELLVVIAIIALLLAILMPALGKVRKQAESVICRTNLKEVGTLVNMYSCANNGSMAIRTAYTLADPYDHHWAKLLGAYYVGNSATQQAAFNRSDDKTGSFFQIKSFRCPVEYKRWKADLVPEAANNPAGEGSAGRGYCGAGTLYGYNDFFSCPVVADAAGSGKPANSQYWWSRKIKQPSTLPIFWDIDSWTHPKMPQNTMFQGYPDWTLFQYGWKGGIIDRSSTLFQHYFAPSANHGKGINYLFADGHVGNPGLWPYDLNTNGLVSGRAMSLRSPGDKEDYWTYFHPIRQVFQGTSRTPTVGDAWQ